MAPGLEDYLVDWADGDPVRRDVAAVLRAIAATTASLAERIALGPLADAPTALISRNAGGDAQTALDIEADAMLFEALRGTPVAAFASEERDEAIALSAGAPLAVAVDPLDGSSNIETNAAIGTIFSILPAAGALAPGASFLHAGTGQLAAGFVIYGPQTALVLTVRQGVQIFTLERGSRVFRLSRSGVHIPEGSREYAINAANQRHWDAPVRAYVDECLAGAEGPRGADYNTRWIASVVAEAYRILIRGGVFLYPGDARTGYREGRLRLVYEASPLALLLEEAGGAATNGVERILCLMPERLHQRVPLIFGAREEVERIGAHCQGRFSAVERFPLFATRGLFRA